jgi:hypothetical protein
MPMSNEAKYIMHSRVFIEKVINNTASRIGVK